MNFSIIPFTIEHYQSALEVWDQSEGVGLSNSDSAERIAFFLERNPGLSLLATKESEVIGTILAGHDGRRGFIHHLAVLPKFRRQGAGSLLANECLKKLKRIGILKCHILMFQDNEIGLRFWRNVGWTYRKDIGVLSKFIE